MAEPIMLARVLQTELPFTLNLPDDVYPIMTKGVLYAIKVMQRLVTAPDGPRGMIFGTRAELRLHFGPRWESINTRELRTILRHIENAPLDGDSLPDPDQNELLEAAQRRFLVSDLVIPRELHGLPRQMQAEDWLATLDPAGLEQFKRETRVRIAANRTFHDLGLGPFFAAMNVLIREYMTTFNDPFVEEIWPGGLSRTEFGGVLISTYSNGQLLEQSVFGGGLVPHVMKTPWRQHKTEALKEFCHRLKTEPGPDAVALLGARARSLLMRGIFRSAIVEASAALDLSLSRKIRGGLSKRGATEIDIEMKLRGELRFDGRAKKLLNEATGRSASELDVILWQRVVIHRKTTRQLVTHADREPGHAVAEQMVSDFLRLAELIDYIPV